MRKMLCVLLALFTMGIGANRAAAQSAQVSAYADTDCGGCDLSPKQKCLLGCPIEDPTNCGPCYDANGMCMYQQNGCGSMAILLDGTLMLLGAPDASNVVTNADVELYAETVDGYIVVYGRRTCDGALVMRRYTAEYAEKLKSAVTVLSI